MEKVYQFANSLALDLMGEGLTRKEFKHAVAASIGVAAFLIIASAI